MSIKIESLSLEKVDEVGTLIHKSYSESFWNQYPFNPVSLREFLVSSVENPTSFKCICIDDNKIIGFFFADLGKFPFCDTLLGMEGGIYVDLPYRGGKAAILMFSSFFKWCDDMKAHPFLEIYYGKDNEKTYNFCKKLGMIECGKIFIGKNHGLCEEDIQ